MADKPAFTSDEWKILLESVMATGLAVTAAEPSGLWGLSKRASQVEKCLLKRKWTSAQMTKRKATTAAKPARSLKITAKAQRAK